MSSRILIQSISIRNFRSIKKDTIVLNNINIFVGLNDAGKSNYLKALNLFFNNETDYHVQFDFNRDFTHFYNPKSHEAKTISIEIRFSVPSSFKDSGVYCWKKDWRLSGDIEESITQANGEKPSSRSRVPGALRRIKYRYVPAVKSREYFKSLLSDLYVTASTVINSPLESSMQEFTSVIQNYTKQIHDEVKTRIGIDSKLSMPSDMRDMFRTLIFETSDDEDFSVPLDARGDGIQARHIPIILKYIADRDKETRNQGSANVSTIWGYEEPENGVELSKAFEMVSDFREYSKDIQMLITTHSPAFYRQGEDDENTKDDIAKVLYVARDVDGTKSSPQISDQYINQTMGLMTLVAPYVKEQQLRLSSLKKEFLQGVLIDVPTVFVEGKTDKAYLETAIHLFSKEKLSPLLDSEKIRIFTKDGEGGCKKISDLALAWILSGNKSKALALYDKDNAGKKARDELLCNPIFIERNSTAGVSVKCLEPSETIIKLYKINIDIDFEIEHLLSASCWNQIIQNNWAVKRDCSKLSKFASWDKTLEESLYDLIEDKDLLNIVINEPGDTEDKLKIQKFVTNANPVIQSEYMSGFQKTINMIEKLFCK